ncbi:hypothetical protein MMC30_007787 [Trapelia coarctata]|nr:hypothetical protein [Trapelia coarctata]
MNLNVRTATPADVGSLLALIGSAYRGEESRKGWTTEADLLTGDRIDEAGLLAKIAEPNGAMLLATDASGALVACCELLRRDDAIGYFGLFAVEPRRQGGGLGKQILQVAESYARETLGVKRLEMQVIWTRAELIAWYLRRGYAGTGEKRPFPYEQLVSGAAALRDDLYFAILEKDLVASKEVVSVVSVA